jgi:tRNA A-37 threonylcarbamoyl transferase component Bud32
MVNVSVDPDGFVRRVLHYYSERSFRTRHSLSLAVAGVLLEHPSSGHPRIEPEPDGLLVRSATGGTLHVPTDAEGMSLIPYSGPGSSVPTLSWKTLLELDGKTRPFSGKAVIVGNARPDSDDAFETPFHRSRHLRIAGVEIHAQALAGMLRQDKLRRAGRPAEVAWTAFWAVAGMLAWRGGLIPAAGIVLLAGLLGATAGLWLYSAERLVLNPLGGVFAIPVIGLVLGLSSRFRERAVSIEPVGGLGVLPGEETIEPEVEQAIVLIESGESSRAISLLQPILDRGRTSCSTRARWTVVLAMVALGDMDAAERQLAAIDLDRVGTGDLYSLARRLEERATADLAVSLYRVIEARNEGFGDVHVRLESLDARAGAVPPEVRRALATRYRDVELLGSGGQARVFRAWDRVRGQAVAIKVPEDPALASPEVRRRFNREIRALLELDHPSIVRVFDVSTEGVCYFTMELLQGDSLKKRLEQRGRMTPQTALEVLVPVAEALAHVHSLGMVHRDVKPENILFNESNVPKLTDFGIIFADSRTRLTASGFAVGTPIYMAPEQMGDEAPAPPIDVYSWAAMLYECLTGRQPFSASEYYRKLVSDPPPLARIVPGIDPELSSLVASCLALDPSRRPPSGRELVARLQPVAAGYGIRVVTASGG